MRKKTTFLPRLEINCTLYIWVDATISVALLGILIKKSLHKLTMISVAYPVVHVVRRAMSLVVRREPRCDSVFKQIFRDHPTCMKSILQAVYNCEIESLTYLDTTIHGVSGDRQTRFDIRVEEKGQVYIVEFEKAVMKQQLNRWVYYGCREYVEQGRLIYHAQQSRAEAKNLDPRSLKREIDKSMDFYTRLVPVRTLVFYDPTASSAPGLLNHWLPCDRVISHIDLIQRESGHVFDTLSWTFVRLDLFVDMIQSPSNRGGTEDPVISNKLCMDWLHLLTTDEGDEVDMGSCTDAGVREAYSVLGTDLHSLPEDVQYKYALERSFGAQLKSARKEDLRQVQMEAAKEMLEYIQQQGLKRPDANVIQNIFPTLSMDDALSLFEMNNM